MDESEKKREIMAAIFPDLIKEAQRDDSEKFYNKKGEDDGKGGPDNKKKEEEEEKGTTQTNPQVDYIK